MDTAINRVIGRRLKQLRMDDHQSQKDIAETLGFWQSDISKIESGERYLHYEELFSYARALHMSSADLFQLLEQDLIDFVHTGTMQAS